MNLIYYSHSYRDPDADVVRFFARLMRSEELIPSLDPPSASLNSAKPERHLKSTDGMVAVLTARTGGVSPYMLYEVSLSLRARRPVLVFVEDTLPAKIVPSRILQRRFSRKGLLRQVRDHRHALGIFKAYIGENPPPTYQPHLSKRSCALVGVSDLSKQARRDLVQEIRALQYRLVEVQPGSNASLYDEREQELLASADLAICFVNARDSHSQYALGAFRASLTPSILLSTDRHYRFHPRVPREYQPRLVPRTGSVKLRETVRNEVRIYEEEYVDLEDQSEVERYGDLLIREASPRGQYTDDLRSIFIQELVMGDKNTGTGQIGAIGSGARASNMTFNQKWSLVENDVDLSVLADELAKLRDAMKEASSAPEHDVAVGEVAMAEKAAREGKGPTVMERLAGAGKWGFEVATKIGTGVAASAIKSGLGL